MNDSIHYTYPSRICVCIFQPDSARLQCVCHGEVRVDVLGEYTGGQAVLCVVSHVDDLIHSLELDDGLDGAEDLHRTPHNTQHTACETETCRGDSGGRTSTPHNITV